MPQIQNSEITNILRNTAKIQLGADSIPNTLSNQIIPTLEINPFIVKEGQEQYGNLTNATSANIMTTPLTQDVYLTSCSINGIRDATATFTYAYIKVVMNGKIKQILRIPGITLTAGTFNGYIYFPHPLKIDRNSTIEIISETNVGNFVISATIAYFVDETSNA